MKHLKKHPAIRALAIFASLAGLSDAQTFNWASPVFGSIVDSSGNALDSSYTFQLGTFANDFNPTADNLAEWGANWLTLDTATYSDEFSFFTSTFDLDSTGASNGVGASAGVFFGMNVYLWVHGGYDAASNTSEWFLAHSDSWVLPEAPEEGGGCCGGTPEQWSTNDLQTGETPVVGGHNNSTGGGTAANPGFYDLQTYNVPIPEPTAPLLLMISSCLLFRRKNPLSSR